METQIPITVEVRETFISKKVVKELMKHQGDKFQQIKAVRMVADIGLKEAKDFVEELMS